MNQKLCLSLTATLLTTAFGISTSLDTKAVASNIEGNLEATQQQLETNTAIPQSIPSISHLREMVQEGEYKSQKAIDKQETPMATVYPHQWKTSPAATLRIRNIPVLTFLASTTADDKQTKNINLKTAKATQPEDNPVSRAEMVASRLNQLNVKNVDAEAINLSWDADSQSYLITLNGEKLVNIDANTILPDTTKNPSQDALQATNRLRRLVGNAPPLLGSPQKLTQTGKLTDSTQMDKGRVKGQKKGVASWYGPGFHGRRTASGERFNQYGMTAAHRSLPFGTRVRVTNVRNGRSVIVRINDRGPHVRGRVIDLSKGAARAIGIGGTGQVQMDILGI